MKCHYCKKKIGIIEFDCKCCNKFCGKCRHPESHSCTFDFKSEQKKKLTKELIKIGPEKIIKIR